MPQRLEGLLEEVIELYQRHKASVPKRVRMELVRTLLTCIVQGSKGHLVNVPKELREELLPLLMKAERIMRGLDD